MPRETPLTLVMFPLGIGREVLPPQTVASLNSDPVASLAGRSNRTLLKTEFSKNRPTEARITVLPALRTL